MAATLPGTSLEVVDRPVELIAGLMALCATSKVEPADYMMVAVDLTVFKIVSQLSVFECSENFILTHMGYFYPEKDNFLTEIKRKEKDRPKSGSM